MSATPASSQEGTPGGGTPVSPSPTSPSRPPNPTMGTCEETYPGSGSYYYVFGGKPKADWSGIEDLSSRTMSDLCFRSLDPVAGQKSSHYRTKPLSTKYCAFITLGIYQVYFICLLQMQSSLPHLLYRHFMFSCKKPVVCIYVDLTCQNCTTSLMKFANSCEKCTSLTL